MRTHTDTWIRLSAPALALSGAAFVVIAAVMLRLEGVDRLDARIVGWVERTAPTGLVEAMQVITYAGSAIVLGPLAFLAALLLARRQQRTLAAFVVSAFVSAVLLTQALKLSIQRARPELDEPIVRLTTFAFPSGHALAATATFGALALALATRLPARRDRRLLVAAAVGLVLVVAASRVLLGAHYLLDVLAGIAAGIAILSALVLALFGRGQLRDEQPQGARLDL